MFFSVILISLCIMNSVVTQIIANSIIAGSLYTIIGLGFFLVYKTVKFFDLGYGVFLAFGGYMMYWLFKLLHVQAVFAVLLALLLTGGLAILIHFFVYRPLRERNSSQMILLVASLGVFTALQAIIAILFTSQFQTIQAPFSQESFEVAGAFVTSTQGIMILSAIILYGVLSLVLQKTRFGKSIRAIADDEEVAQIVGIPTRKVIRTVFFLSGVIAALVGILVGFDTGIEPTMGMSLLLKGVIAVIIGGLGRMYGVVIGAFVLAFLENLAVWHISGEWKDVVAFSILIIFLLIRPKGITGNNEFLKK